MKPTLNEKFLAYLALFSGLFLSLVAEYYSILGLTAIFSAAVIPVIIMGIALGLGKVTATLWLKQNWSIAPWTMRGYLFTAIIVLMLVTSMGIFGFLSKAHSDQSLVSGDVQSKIAVYDEKIKTERENIDVNRKALKQLDESVDQVMGRSQDEKGAEKAVAIRRTQQKERSRLAQDIADSQKRIATLNEERAPIAAEVRKVEAEVGPIKYIAAFVYGETNEGILEKAVTWVIITLIVVFDPMAVILLLSSQISFQNFREREKEDKFAEWTEDDFDQLAEDNLSLYDFDEIAEGNSPQGLDDVVESQPTVTDSDPHPIGWMFNEIPVPYPSTDAEVEEVIEALAPVREKTLLEQHPYLTKKFDHFENLKPLVYKPELDSMDDRLAVHNPPVDDAYLDEPLFVQNEEQQESSLWTGVISHEEYMQASQDKIELHVNEIAELVRQGKMTMDEVPEALMAEVKARV
jgi:hypothetical protein